MYQVMKGVRKCEKMYQLLPLVGKDTVPSLFCLIRKVWMRHLGQNKGSNQNFMKIRKIKWNDSKKMETQGLPRTQLTNTVP